MFLQWLCVLLLQYTVRILFLCFSSYSFFCISLFWVSFSSTSFCLVAISPRVPIFLIVPSHTLSSCYHFCFLSLGVSVIFFFLICSAIPWVPLSSSMGSFGFFCGFVSPFVPLSFFSLLLVLLLLSHTFFFPYTLVFSVYASHFSSLILFWIIASIVYYPHFFVSRLVGFLVVEVEVEANDLPIIVHSSFL